MQVTAGGPTVKVTGTVQEVYAQLKQVNPDFEKEFPPGNATDALKARATQYTISHYFCEGRWPTCNWWQIKAGVDYLNGVPGRPVRLRPRKFVDFLSSLLTQYSLTARAPATAVV